MAKYVVMYQLTRPNGSKNQTSVEVEAESDSSARSIAEDKVLGMSTYNSECQFSVKSIKKK